MKYAFFLTLALQAATITQFGPQPDIAPQLPANYQPFLYDLSAIEKQFPQDSVTSYQVGPVTLIAYFDAVNPAKHVIVTTIAVPWVSDALPTLQSGTGLPADALPTPESQSYLYVLGGLLFICWRLIATVGRRLLLIACAL